MILMLLLHTMYVAYKFVTWLRSKSFKDQGVQVGTDDLPLPPRYDRIRRRRGMALHCLPGKNIVHAEDCASLNGQASNVTFIGHHCKLCG